MRAHFVVHYPPRATEFAQGVELAKGGQLGIGWIVGTRR
jgi:hypothetical protein